MQKQQGRVARELARRRQQEDREGKAAQKRADQLKLRSRKAFAHAKTAARKTTRKIKIMLKTLHKQLATRDMERFSNQSSCGQRIARKREGSTLRRGRKRMKMTLSSPHRSSASDCDAVVALLSLSEEN